MGKAFSESTLLYIAKRCEKTIQMIIEIAKKEYGVTIPLKIETVVPANIAQAIISTYGITKSIKQIQPIIVPAKAKTAPVIIPKNKKKTDQYSSKTKEKPKQNQQLLEEAYKEKKIVEGRILEPLKKNREILGFFVDVYGFKALMYTNEFSNKSSYPKEGNLIKVLIYKYVLENNEIKLLVSNERALSFISLNNRRKQQLKNIQKGKRYKGTIEKIYEKSLLVKIEDLVGIVPIRDIFWGYTRRQLDEIFEEGQELDVVVSEPLSYNDNGKPLITLSHKACIPNYWYDDKNYPIGAICEGKIIDIMDNGIIVEIEPGFEGFVPVSELSHSILNKLNQFSEEQIQNISKDFKVRIIDKDPGNMRLIISVLQTYDNWIDKWEHISDDYSVGNTYDSIIVAIENDRLWVSLCDGLEASISKSELSWPKIYQKENSFHNYDEVKVMLLTIDQEKKRISASIRKCEPNPWDLLVENITVNDSIAFKIIEKRPPGYKIVACDNMNLLGFLPSSEISWYPVIDDLEPNRKYVGKVLELSANSSTLKVSLKRMMPNPWDSIIVGRTIQGTLMSKEGGRLIIDLGNGLTGYSIDDDYSRKRMSIDFKIIGFNTLSKEIQLSHKRIKFDSEMDVIIKDFFNNRNI